MHYPARLLRFFLVSALAGLFLFRLLPLWVDRIPVVRHAYETDSDANVYFYTEHRDDSLFTFRSPANPAAAK